MLDGLRGFAKSWPGKILGAFMLVGIAGFGINNVITDLGSNTVAHVGNQDITAREFQRAYQNQLNRVTSQIGSVPTASQAEAMGLPTNVLLGLAEGKALDGMADQMGLGVSDARLAQMLRTDPSFFGTLGTFEPKIFTQVLQSAGWTESDYFAARSSEAKRDQIVQSLFGKSGLPKVATDLINGYASSTRTIDYMTLTAANVPTPAAPTDAELQAYLTEHQSEFRTVETRKVKLLDLSLPSLAATKTISDADITAEYERTKDSLTTPERRTIEQVALNTPELQAQFKAGLDAGTSFADLVAAAKVTPSSLGTLAKSEITDTNLANAAFSLNQGAFSLISGVGGERAVHVSAIEAATTPSEADAKKAISDRLATAAARTDINDILDQIEELRAAFQPIDQIAGRFGLKTYEAEVTAGGSELSVVTTLAPGDYQRVAQAIFAAKQDQLVPAVSLTNNAHLWFDLEQVSPARDQNLDEVREKVTADITQQRTNEALQALGNQIVDRIKKGESLSDIGVSMSVFSQVSPQFTRFGSQDGLVDSVLAGAAFAGGADYAGTVTDQNGDFIVFQVVGTTEPTAPLPADALASINNEGRAGLYSEFVSAVRDTAGLRINQQALSNLLVQNYGQ